MAANAYTKELLVSMSDNDRQMLNLIDEALVRIDDSGYGKCIRCGYLPWKDKATALEHTNACEWGGPEYTADPACNARTWHYPRQWCDVCKGVA